jgi:hypothetical protein
LVVLLVKVVIALDLVVLVIIVVVEVTLRESVPVDVRVEITVVAVEVELLDCVPVAMPVLVAVDMEPVETLAVVEVLTTVDVLPAEVRLDTPLPVVLRLIIEVDPVTVRLLVDELPVDVLPVGLLPVDVLPVKLPPVDVLPVDMLPDDRLPVAMEMLPLEVRDVVEAIPVRLDVRIDEKGLEEAGAVVLMEVVGGPTVIVEVLLAVPVERLCDPVDFEPVKVLVEIRPDVLVLTRLLPVEEISVLERPVVDAEVVVVPLVPDLTVVEVFVAAVDEVFAVETEEAVVLDMFDIVEMTDDMVDEVFAVDVADVVEMADDLVVVVEMTEVVVAIDEAEEDEALTVTVLQS